MNPLTLIVTKTGHVVELDTRMCFALRPGRVAWCVTVLTPRARDYYRPYARLVSLAQMGRVVDGCRDLDESESMQYDRDVYRGRIRGRRQLAHSY